MFKRHAILGTFAALVAVATLSLGVTSASARGEGERVSIPFANTGNIKDWRAYDHDTLYVEASGGQWYKATLWGPCLSLPFSETIAFVTESNGSLDKFSSILVDGHQCYFRSFSETTKPTKPGS